MTHFQPSFIEFFRELSKNNNKEWFDQNRKTYEKEVKKPFSEFVTEMIHRIAQHEPSIKISSSDAIMRINKDVRFSKDKTPYNTHTAANISVYGKKDKSYPGFYFQFSHDKISIFGGAYAMDPPALQKIRSYIASNLKRFSDAYTNSDFKEKFGQIQGEKHVRLPEEFKHIADKEPLIANKQFYYTTDIAPNILLSEELPAILMEHYLAGKKLNAFLINALEK